MGETPLQEVSSDECFVERIEVLCNKDRDVLVVDDHETLSGEKNYAMTDKARPTNNPLLYHRGIGLGTKSERVYLCIWENSVSTNLPILSVDVRGLPLDTEGRLQVTQEGQVSKILFTSDLTTINASSTTFQLGRPTAKDENYDLHQVPFGVFGQLQFHFLIEHVSVYFVSEIPLEFYCLSSRYLPQTLNSGIPLSLLRMFLQPLSGKERPKTTEEWIALVVGIVHGSRAPFTGSPCSTTEHWLRYESWGGGKSFTNYDGWDGLNVRAWLDSYLNWKVHGEFTFVNCYDQAAITQVALALGMPHDQIHWEYHQTYGFIRNSQLVGWGMCNNPYFEDDVSKIIYENLEDEQREPFRNHAYLSWTTKPLTQQDYNDYNTAMRKVKSYPEYQRAAREFEKTLKSKMRMIDACAGPHMGTETRYEYECNKEPILDPALSFSTYVQKNSHSHPLRWIESHELGDGITALSVQALGILLPPGMSDIYNSEHSRILKLLQNVGDGLGISSITVAQLKEAFKAKFDQLVEDFHWNKETVRWVTIRPYEQRQGVTVHEAKVHFRTAKESSSKCYLSLRVSVCDAQDTARDQLAAHLAFSELINKFGENAVKSLPLLQSSMSVVGRPDGWLRAFVWRNIACELTGWGNGNETYDGITATITKTLLS